MTVGAASYLYSRDIESATEKTFTGDDVARRDFFEWIAGERLVTVVREEWREDESGNLDLESDPDHELTVYVRPSAMDVAAMLEHMSIESVEVSGDTARIYSDVTEYYGTTVSAYVAVPQARAERFYVELAGWNPRHLRTVLAGAISQPHVYVSGIDRLN